MSNYPYPLLNQPPFTYSRNDNVVEPKAHEWIRPIDDEPSSWKMYDAVILGIPLSRSSISASYPTKIKVVATVETVGTLTTRSPSGVCLNKQGARFC